MEGIQSLLTIVQFQPPPKNSGEALVISLDGLKAFDSVWHVSLIGKVSCHGIIHGLIAWNFGFPERHGTTITF